MIELVKGRVYQVSGRGISQRVIYFGECEVDKEVNHLFLTKEGLQKLTESTLSDWAFEESQENISDPEIVNLSEFLLSVLSGDIGVI